MDSNVKIPLHNFVRDRLLLFCEDSCIYFHTLPFTFSCIPYIFLYSKIKPGYVAVSNSLSLNIEFN